MSALLLLLSLASAQDLAIRGAVVHPVSGPSIENGVVLVEDGKISAVGADVTIPDGVRVLEAAVVTPGFVDALTVAPPSVSRLPSPVSPNVGTTRLTMNL